MGSFIHVDSDINTIINIVDFSFRIFLTCLQRFLLNIKLEPLVNILNIPNLP